MDIMLIDVGTSRDELNEPLGIEVIAGTIRHHFPGSVFVNMEYSQLNDKLFENPKILYEYDIIGISTKLFSYNRLQKIIESIKHANHLGKKPLIVVGDLLATFAYRQLLSRYNDIICVLGEGEDAICGIIKIILDRQSLNIDGIKEEIIHRIIPNIAIRHNEKLVINPRKVVNLNNSVKPARDFLHEIIENGGIVRIEGSRGCPWGRCTFCAISAKYGYCGWRPFKVDKIIDELEEISNAGAISPYFTDEDFIGTNPDRVEKIADKIMKAKEQGRIDDKLNFYINMPINAVISHKKLLIKLKKVGLREVFIGLESGAKTQIQRYKKLASKNNNFEAIKILNDLDLTIDIGFIMFDPEMSFDDLKENMNFIRTAGLIDHDARDIKRVRVEPNTGLEKELKAKGIITSELDINGLRYIYKFKDPLVQKVVDIFEQWEEGTKNIVYSLQGEMRGEIMSEEIRISQKNLLGRFRKLDFEFLEDCINMVEKSSDNIIKDELFDSYSTQRRKLINNLKLMVTDDG